MGRNRLRYALAASLLSAILGGVGCQPRSAAPITSVYLVRHAEKVAGTPDPTLTAEGRARAQALAHMLADAGVEAIYSTEFARTRQTAQAVAVSTGLEVQIFPIGESSMEAFIEGMARKIVDGHAGATLLVVGHSNTVPALMRELGAREAPDLTEQDYDDLFLLEFRDGSARLRQLHYGNPSP